MMRTICYVSQHGLSENVRQTIGQEENMKLIGEFPYTQGAGKLVPLFQPDVVLFDMDGLQTADIISAVNIMKAENPNMKVIAVVTSGRRDSELLQIIEAGIDSLLEKTDDCRKRIIHIIEKVMDQHFIMPHHLTRPFEKCLLIMKTTSFDIFSKQLKENGIRLSNRETEVAYWLRLGYCNRDIARKLLLAEGAVRVYVSRVYGKLNCSERQELVDKLRNLTNLEDEQFA
ncbi:response regulator transcription factor [Lentibacillus lipolyticus]|nr:response regulator transcription factor [Lentibacillus lipolyticus]